MVIFVGKVIVMIGFFGCGKLILFKVFNCIVELEGWVKVIGKIEFFG